MRRAAVSLGVCVGVVFLVLALAPSSAAQAPWFGAHVGGATQVISVVGQGGSTATMDVWQRGVAGWEPVGTGIPVHVGANGMVKQSHDGGMATPMGVFTLDFAFGTQPNPGGGLPYVRVTPNHWWDGDLKSPTYNTMQVCAEADCPFNTAPSSGTENLHIPQYEHAVVMGVNKARVPGNGGAFFVHTTDGGPTAGCVSLDDDTLVKIIRWLKPGAMIAVAQ